MSVGELAKATGLSRGIIYKLEAGDLGTTTVKTLERIAGALNVSLVSLLREPATKKAAS